MEDLISRQAAIDVLTESLNKIPMINNTTNEMIRRDERITCIHEIIRLLSADRPSGEWVEDTYGWVYCSHCKKYLDDYQMVFFLKPFDYCPNCGARMLKGGNYAAD